MKVQLPKLEEERKIWSFGYDFVIGVDEVGRGPLAGPVVAGACMFKKIKDEKMEYLLSLGINDSKKLTPKKRESIFEELTRSDILSYGIGIVDEKIVDNINILQASLLAMKIAIENLKIKDEKSVFVLIDGRELIPEVNLNQRAIIGGDAKVLAIAAASIIAKVARDRIMDDYDKKYPEYGFKKHKGYGTKFHFEMIKKYGHCDIHRKSFLH
ncbi:MAG: ribonuclease HII [Patescibacteria group bacterium]